MRFNKILLIGIGLLCLVACEKDPKAVTKDYLDGIVKLSFPRYVAPGYTKEFCVDTLMTLVRPDGGTIGYYYRGVDDQKSDTLVLSNGTIVKNKFTITAPTETVSASFSFTGFCEDKYYSSSSTVKFDVVKPGFDGTGSLTEFSIIDGELSFTDERDNKLYYYTNIAGIDWMRNNLAWAGAGTSYSDSEVMDNIFGRLYTQEEAQTACPEGWRLPSDEDWTIMAQSLDPNLKEGTNFEGIAGKLMGDIKFNDNKLWEYWKEVYISDETRLSLIPLGYALKEDKYVFKGDHQYAVLWTSDTDADQGIIRYIYEKQDIVFVGKASSQDFACSVRCVR